ncbi:MAG: hypothetical protein ACK5L6_13500 [Anaerorhabdus sp.]|uniref:hypothetical protein n=1 Tax=Anaerorhabdus sp. TaxID=1872524 RepID=UPI003A872ECC
MNIVYSLHEGSQEIKPLTIDTNSSQHCVYLRRNIQRITKEDGMGNSVSLWQYEEACISFADFEKYKEDMVLELSDKVSNDNLILMEAVASNYEQTILSQDNQLIIMSAIADLYDTIANIQK